MCGTHHAPRGSPDSLFHAVDSPGPYGKQCKLGITSPLVFVLQSKSKFALLVGASRVQRDCRRLFSRSHSTGRRVHSLGQPEVSCLICISALGQSERSSKRRTVELWKGEG